MEEDKRKTIEDEYEKFLEFVSQEYKDFLLKLVEQMKDFQENIIIKSAAINGIINGEEKEETKKEGFEIKTSKEVSQI